MSNKLYKQTAIEFAKIAFNATKIVAICATALVACVGMMYLIGWEGDAAFFGGMIIYAVLGWLYCMIDMAHYRARIKRDYPDLADLDL